MAAGNLILSRCPTAWKERLVASGAEPVGNTPAEYAAEIKAELDKMKNLVQKQGIKFDGT